MFYRRSDSSHVFGWQVKQQRKRNRAKDLVITSSEANAMAVFQSTGILALSLKSVHHLPQEVGQV